MGRAIWKGNISFGLVNVPVAVHSAERRADLRFQLIDSRNAARVRYERVNEETGDEVPWNKIVKGFEYSDGSYVLLSEKDFKSVAPEMTRTIEIEKFVEASEIDAIYFDKPYFLEPAKGGNKGYVLLREALRQSSKIGIAKVVIRSKQYLAALLTQGDLLVLNLMRFHQEIRTYDDLDIPSSDLKQSKIQNKEVELAQQLIEGMTRPWNPADFHDDFRDALLELVEKKIRSGQAQQAESENDEEDQDDEEEVRTINFMDVLKQSVAQAQQAGRTAGKGEAKSPAASRGSSGAVKVPRRASKSTSSHENRSAAKTKPKTAAKKAKTGKAAKKAPAAKGRGKKAG